MPRWQVAALNEGLADAFVRGGLGFGVIGAAASAICAVSLRLLPLQVFNTATPCCGLQACAAIAGCCAVVALCFVCGFHRGSISLFLS
jgi:hypothetical protein